ncbi:pentapeptide repeat-containing protein [Kiloniella laminariae]|uniref:pentapeptide repeat-containing protein n=1 Tax=Kiloniella laminariae TaxID=454162 RepID=UPI00037145CC|nr:pentapeptide repeat-containing protein [Kiloniella laminariae]
MTRKKRPACRLCKTLALIVLGLLAAIGAISLVLFSSEILTTIRAGLNEGFGTVLSPTANPAILPDTASGVAGGISGQWNSAPTEIQNHSILLQSDTDWPSVAAIILGPTIAAFLTFYAVNWQSRQHTRTEQDKITRNIIDQLGHEASHVRLAALSQLWKRVQKDFFDQEDFFLILDQYLVVISAQRGKITYPDSSSDASFDVSLLEQKNGQYKKARLETRSILQFYKDKVHASIPKRARNWSFTNLYGMDLSATDLQETNLENSILTRARFTGSNLNRVNLHKALMQGVSLKDTKLKNTDLTQARLSPYITSRGQQIISDLSGADLSHADLTGADLSQADLTGADLTHVDLTGAVFEGADLTSACLKGAKLNAAQLTTCHGLTADQLAVAWAEENAPPGLPAGLGLKNLSPKRAEISAGK